MNTKNLSLILIAVASIFFTSCSNPPHHPHREPGYVGGYSPIGVDNRDVITTAQFAVSREAKVEHVSIVLDRVLQAEQQIVAGTNYRLTLRVSQAGHLRNAEALVFRSLDGHYELKSWHWVR